MRVKLLAAAIAIGMLPGLASAVETVDFKLNTTRDLLDLCGVTPSDPLYKEAINFCVGYFEGAGDYHDSVVGGPIKPLFCHPKGATRADAIRAFLIWGQANQRDRQLMDDPPLRGVIRALASKWPCKK